MPSDNVEPQGSKETNTVEIWKDEVTEEIQEQPMCLPPEEELLLDRASLAFRIQNNFLVISFE